MNVRYIAADSVERRDQLVFGEEELIGSLFEQEAPSPPLRGSKVGAPDRRPCPLSFLDDVEVAAIAW